LRVRACCSRSRRVIYLCTCVASECGRERPRGCFCEPNNRKSPLLLRVGGQPVSLCREPAFMQDYRDYIRAVKVANRSPCVVSLHYPFPRVRGLPAAAGICLAGEPPFPRVWGVAEENEEDYPF
jgi:hypothetical protein